MKKTNIKKAASAAKQLGNRTDRAISRIMKARKKRGLKKAGGAARRLKR